MGKSGRNSNRCELPQIKPFKIILNRIKINELEREGLNKAIKRTIEEMDSTRQQPKRNCKKSCLNDEALATQYEINHLS